MVADLLFYGSIPLALFGVYLWARFLWMRFSDGIHELEISGFQKAKNKGRVLPIVRYEDSEKNLRLVEIKKIEQFSYLFNPAIQKQIVDVVNVKGASPTIYGYIKPVSGLICLLPGVAALALNADRILVLGQVFYIVIFIAVLLGGWAVLKLIQRMGF